MRVPNASGPLKWKAAKIEARFADWVRKALPYPPLSDAGYPYDPEMIGVESHIELPLRHRFLLLVYGRLVVKATVQCDQKVNQLRASCHAYVCPAPWLISVVSFLQNARP